MRSGLNKTVNSPLFTGLRLALAACTMKSMDAIIANGANKVEAFILGMAIAAPTIYVLNKVGNHLDAMADNPNIDQASGFVRLNLSTPQP